jgi:hypothetical protein
VLERAGRLHPGDRDLLFALARVHRERLPDLTGWFRRAGHSSLEGTTEPMRPILPPQSMLTRHFGSPGSSGRRAPPHAEPPSTRHDDCSPAERGRTGGRTEAGASRK